MSRTDQELILARAWAMLSSVEREAIADAFAEGHVTFIGQRGLDKLADEWIEELRVEKGLNPKTGKKPTQLRKLGGGRKKP